MSTKVTLSPFYTFRGHASAVSALGTSKLTKRPCLLSGDEDGTVALWYLDTLKNIKTLTKLVPSKIQTIKVIQFIAQQVELALIQSRNHGVFCYNLNNLLSDDEPTHITILDTYDALFSRGDACVISDELAALAYPSSMENFLVTIRIIDSKVTTTLSGTAQRNQSKNSKTCTVFDIRLQKDTLGSDYLVFSGYEDGCLCVFGFNPSKTRPVIGLNMTCIDVTHLKTYDLKIGDFISSYDVIDRNDKNHGDGDSSHEMMAICGSPLKKVTQISFGLRPSSAEPYLKSTTLASAGVGCVAVSSDREVVALAGWNKWVKLYNIQTMDCLATLRFHLEQVLDLLFISDQDNLVGHILCCGSKDGTVSLTRIDSKTLSERINLSS